MLFLLYFVIKNVECTAAFCLLCKYGVEALTRGILEKFQISLLGQLGNCPCGHYVGKKLGIFYCSVTVVALRQKIELFSIAEDKLVSYCSKFLLSIIYSLVKAW